MSAPIVGHLDFTISGVLLAAIAIGGLQPIYLFALTRLPMIAGRNAIQFLLSCAVTLLLWAFAITLTPGLRQSSLVELALGLMALAGGMLVYLEIWGLMSRGYTLGIILTLYNAGRLLSEAEVSRSYRGGEGLAWIMRHRVGGLMAAGLVAKRNEDLVLTPLRGRIVAHLYRISIFVLGVRRTG